MQQMCMSTRPDLQTLAVATVGNQNALLPAGSREGKKAMSHDPRKRGSQQRYGSLPAGCHSHSQQS